MTAEFSEAADRIELWRQQVARYRSFSRLLREDEGSGVMAGLALGLEAQIEKLDALRGEVRLHQLRTQVLLAELDTLRAHLRSLPDNPCLASGDFTADDVREESRLCLEEAEAAEEIAAKRLFAAHAFELARMAKEMSRPDG